MGHSMLPMLIKSLPNVLCQVTHMSPAMEVVPSQACSVTYGVGTILYSRSYISFDMRNTGMVEHRLAQFLWYPPYLIF